MPSDLTESAAISALKRLSDFFGAAPSKKFRGDEIEAILGRTVSEITNLALNTADHSDNQPG